MTKKKVFYEYLPANDFNRGSVEQNIFGGFASFDSYLASLFVKLSSWIKSNKFVLVGFMLSLLSLVFFWALSSGWLKLFFFSAPLVFSFGVFARRALNFAKVKKDFEENGIF